MQKHQDVFQKDKELFRKRLIRLFKNFICMPSKGKEINPLVKYRLYHVEQKDLLSLRR